MGEGKGCWRIDIVARVVRQREYCGKRSRWEGSGPPGSGGDRMMKQDSRYSRLGFSMRMHHAVQLDEQCERARERGPGGDVRNVIVSACARAPDCLSRLARPFMPLLSRHDVCLHTYSTFFYLCFAALVCSLAFQGPSLGEKKVI